MANKFDVVNYPTIEPSILFVGDRVTWKRSDLGVDYPPASYTLKYSCRLEGDGSKEIEITATGSGTDFLIEESQTVSVLWTAGIYHWQAYVIRDSDSERITINKGTFDLRPNRDASTVDPRTDAKIAYDNALVLWKAVTTYGSYSINGRNYTYRNITEIIALVDRTRSDYEREVNKEKFAKLGIDPRKVGIRFAKAK